MDKMVWASSREFSLVSTATDGSVYIAGTTNGDLDGQTNSGGYDAFLSKLNSDGSEIWTRLLGTTSYEGATSVSAAKDGSVYILGETRGNLDGYTNSSGYANFLSKYDGDGNKLWTQLSDKREANARSVDTAEDGSVYITGITRET